MDEPEGDVVTMGEAMLRATECPKCGGAVEHGYGLAFGGFGPYAYCIGHPAGYLPGDGCGWYHKVQDEVTRGE